jgi:hypothetical protein
MAQLPRKEHYGHRVARNGQSAISHQPSAISHQPSAISHQPSAISHQPNFSPYCIGVKPSFSLNRKRMCRTLPEPLL